MSSKKKVLITGASSGMGRVTAMLLCKNGYNVYAGSRTPQKLQSIQNDYLTPIHLDLKDFKSIKEAVDKIENIDILINNAGYGLISTVEDVKESEMVDQFNINVFGVLRTCKAVIPKMRKQNSGIIINISSFLGKTGLPLFTFYNATKYALEGITDSLRFELKDFNIRVHSILPGFFDTNFARDNLVLNKSTFSLDSPYKQIVSNLVPKISDFINNGNDKIEVAKLILKIIKDSNYKVREGVGEKAKKFIPIRQTLSDEEFERFVRNYYNLN